MKELVIISGKGGTGKTSICSAFASLASAKMKTVFADCDVDAADLHLIFNPDIQQTHEFISGKEAIIDEDRCTGCGKCAELCRFDAIRQTETGKYSINGCEGCGLCVRFCPVQAISFPERRCGEWYTSETRFGSLIHAKLDAQAENSGKLVSLVREKAREKAQEQGAELLLVDACPGIACPVIASITGCDAVLAVVEPSLSSLHDLERVIGLTKHFSLPLSVIINKFDINTEVAQQIQDLCKTRDIAVLGMISYDTVFTAAQLEAKSVMEYDNNSRPAQYIQKIWNTLETFIKTDDETTEE